MKKTGARVAVLALFLMLAVGCGSSSDDETAGGTGGANVGNIGQVEVGMSEQQVKDLLGEPIGSMTESIGSVQTVMIYEGITVYLENGAVTKVEKK